MYIYFVSVTKIPKTIFKWIVICVEKYGLVQSRVNTLNITNNKHSFSRSIELVNIILTFRVIRIKTFISNILGILVRFFSLFFDVIVEHSLSLVSVCSYHRFYIYFKWNDLYNKSTYRWNDNFEIQHIRLTKLRLKFKKQNVEQ